jgi:hypothetical protein
MRQIMVSYLTDMWNYVCGEYPHVSSVDIFTTCNMNNEKRNYECGMKEHSNSGHNIKS